MNYLADLHVHSTFSCDAHDSLETMCQSAVTKGLKYICFTEHLDLNPHDAGFAFFDYAGFSTAVDRARAKFGDRIEILKGLEFGEPHLYPREFEQWAGRDFDLILGAVHTIDDRFIGDKELLKKFTVDQLVEMYYMEVLQAVRYGGFDVLAHLDFPKRYLQPLPKLPDLTEEILRELVRQGITLEINTSPLRKGLAECSPNLSAVQSFLQYGGKQFTIGSDAHFYKDIATGYEHVFEMFAKINPPINGCGVFRKRNFRDYQT